MQYLTIDELKDLLRNVETEEDRLMFVIAYWHGLRAEEVCGISDPATLKRNKLGPNETLGLTGANIADGFLDVKRLKGSNRTRQPYMKHEDPLLDEAAGLREIAKKIGPKDVLFPITRFQLRYRFAKAARKAGLPRHKQHPHCLKHSIAKHTIKDAGIEIVRQWLGHKTISSTGEYLKVDDQTAAEAVIKVAAGGK